MRIEKISLQSMRDGREVENLNTFLRGNTFILTKSELEIYFSVRENGKLLLEYNKNKERKRNITSHL